MKIKVKNEWNVPNQFVIETEEGTYFQSYDSIIVFVSNKPLDRIQLGKDWAFSVTTGKYRNKFLNETKKETEAKLRSGEYILNEKL